MTYFVSTAKDFARVRMIRSSALLENFVPLTFFSVIVCWNFTTGDDHVVGLEDGWAEGREVGCVGLLDG